MQRFYALEPEVAGSLGPRTVMDSTVHPPRVSHLQYLFHGWLGDQLLEAFPCLVATESLGNLLVAAQLTGFELGSVEVCRSEEFYDLQPGTVLPKFVWLRVSGIPGVDDLGTTSDARLVVSGRAMSVIEQTWPSGLVKTPYAPPLI